MIVGFYVYVGVDDVDKVVWVVNEFCWYFVFLFVFFVNFFFWNGFDIGFVFVCVKVFENFLNIGMLIVFDDFEEFQCFECWMVEYGLIDDWGEFWYDVCFYIGYGMVEICIFDVQIDFECVIDFVEYVYVFVLDFVDCYEVGELGMLVC